MIAAIQRDVAGVLAAVAAGANVRVDDDAALRSAAAYGNIEVAIQLIEMGADIHTANDAVLRCAAVGGNIKAVRMFLAAGADPVRAWLGSEWIDNYAPMAATLTACADAMTSAQRAALAQTSDKFAVLKAMTATATERKKLQR